MKKKLYRRNNLSMMSKFIGVEVGTINNWKAGIRAGQRNDKQTIRKFQIALLGFNMICDEVEKSNSNNIDDVIEKVMKDNQVIYKSRNAKV